MSSPTVFPRPLRRGDRVAIVSPASIINPDYVESAVRWLRVRGYEPVVASHTLGTYGSYSAPAGDRLADLRAAIADPDLRAILCSRGGYGAVHLIPGFPIKMWMDDPRWLIGFSDISALHALLNSRGIVSVHASMCKALATRPVDDTDNQCLLDILEGARPTYHLDPYPTDHYGSAGGILRGGNLAVISGLISTPVSPFARPDDTILFIEDIAEPIYKVERILWQLRLSGYLDRVAGIAVGRFTEYRPDRNYSDMATMIVDMLAPCRCPVSFGLPVGHVDHNIPLLSGAPVRLTVDSDGATLDFI